jgi:hypothetical protein
MAIKMEIGQSGSSADETPLNESESVAPEQMESEALQAAPREPPRQPTEQSEAAAIQWHAPEAYKTPGGTKGAIDSQMAAEFSKSSSPTAGALVVDTEVLAGVTIFLAICILLALLSLSFSCALKLRLPRSADFTQPLEATTAHQETLHEKQPSKEQQKPKNHRWWPQFPYAWNLRLLSSLLRGVWARGKVTPLPVFINLPALKPDEACNAPS